MKKIIFLASALVSISTFAQVGINETTPSATLDIKSKGSTSTTKALEVNNSSGTDSGSSVVYSTNTIFRDYAVARRTPAGAIHASSYGYANPQKLIVAYQSTVVNEKVALFVNYAGGDSYNTQTCNMNRPNASDNYGYLIVTKL